MIKKFIKSIDLFFKGFMFLYVIESRISYENNIAKLKSIGEYKGLETVNQALEVYFKLKASGMQDSDVDKICKLIVEGKIIWQNKK